MVLKNKWLVLLVKEMKCCQQLLIRILHKIPQNNEMRAVEMSDGNTFLFFGEQIDNFNSKWEIIVLDFQTSTCLYNLFSG